MISSSKTIEWEGGPLIITLSLDEEGHPYLQSIRNKGSKAPETPKDHNPALPLTEIRVAGEGNEVEPGTSKRAMGSYLGRRMKYVKHWEDRGTNSSTLHVESHDEGTGISVINHYTVYGDIPVVRTSATARNDNKSSETQVLQLLSSLALGGIGFGTAQWSEDYRVHFANSTWFREAQWVDRSLPDLGLDDIAIAQQGINTSRACFDIVNVGSFSTNGHLAMGALEKTDLSETYLWSIEHNGGWRWEIADYEECIYVIATGPDDSHHSWQKPLKPGESFTSATVGLAVVDGSSELAFQAMTRYRRAIRRPHVDNEHLPIIFNDYMNCLMGDPTTEKVLALVGPAAKAGAEYFVIDCGWYASDDGWWETVGEWEENRGRFPEGLKYVTDKIREAGMKPGLWVEPEVFGISCKDKSLPPDAFFTRSGQKIVEQGRYQLDYRCQAVIERMNRVIARLVQDYGAQYFKFDYNIDVTQHTDLHTSSPGEAALDHNRAYLAWVTGIMDRFSDVIIETCSSGGQRMDGALLSLHPIQSTSDQQDPLLYSAISVNIPTAVTPEQSASWAYPLDAWSPEVVAMTVINSILGRVHLSGRLDTLSAEKLELVKQGMDVYKTLRLDLRTAVPFWPLGFATWREEWIALGMECEGGKKMYVSVWRRPRKGAFKRKTDKGVAESVELPIVKGKGKACKVQCLYPDTGKFPGEYSWDKEDGVLRVEVPGQEACARLLRLEID